MLKGQQEGRLCSFMKAKHTKKKKKKVLALVCSAGENAPPLQCEDRKISLQDAVLSLHSLVNTFCWKKSWKLARTTYTFAFDCSAAVILSASL